MDWATHDHAPSPRAEPPMPTLLKPSWRATSRTGNVLACGLYQGVAGRIEVRVTYGDDDLIRSALVRDVVTARDIAAAWKDAVIAKGFTEL